MNHPPEEHCEVTDWFTTPLPNWLMRQQEMIFEAERGMHEAELVALRWEEGTACMQWRLSKLMAKDAVLVKAEKIERCLRELVVFANTGREPGWLKAARAELREGR